MGRRPEAVEVGRRDFELLRVLGTGAYGKVMPFPTHSHTIALPYETHTETHVLPCDIHHCRCCCAARPLAWTAGSSTP